MSITEGIPQSRIDADSIMIYVAEHAALYADAVSGYQAEVYIKGRTLIERKNLLINFAHHIFPVDKKKPDVIFEMVSQSEYEAPNLYHHDFKAVNGNSFPSRKKQQEILTFLNLNVYSPTIYDETIMTPVGKKASRFYDFNLVSVEEIEERKLYQIRYTPKHTSQKLVSGVMYVTSDDWRIERIIMCGRFEFAEFHLEMTFGDEFGPLILPARSNLELKYNVMGNTVKSTYYSSFDYKSVEWKKPVPKENKRQWKSLDLTKYYTITSDSIPFIHSEFYWNEKRDTPLTPGEQKAYEINYFSDKKEKIQTNDSIDYLKLTERLTSNIKYETHSTRIRYSGILNPFQLGYSSRNGITYKQKIRITKTFDNGRQIVIRPEVGYMFKSKELFFKLLTEWHYKPEKRGSLRLTIANDNQSYSSRMLNEINEHLKDSLFTFDDLNLDYYRHYYVDLRNKIEVFNGFEFEAGTTFHKRIPVKKKTKIDPGEEIEDIINDTYYDFTPFMSFTYTPRQFYLMNDKFKEYVYSYYPTLSLTIAQGIPGVLGSTGNYGRVEADIEQSLKISLLRKFKYHISAGIYTRQKSIYFADFEYFTRRNFPESWGEERIGGVFHTLRREWFYASDKYLQGHFMYESPFIFSRLINKTVSQHILSERLYLGQLWTPAINSYTEVGYGIGNAVFNIGIFAGFKGLGYERFGLRFSFELD